MLRLYYDLMSQPSRAVFMFLRANNINFEKKRINLGKGEHMTEEYRAVNKFGLVPVIDDNGFVLTESVGILRYLCQSRRGDVPDHWYPQDPRGQARVDEYLEWQHLNTRGGCGMYFRAKFGLDSPLGRDLGPQDLNRLQGYMEDALDKMETQWLGDGRPFLTGDKLSLADLLGACEVEQPRLVGYDPCAGRPRLTAWLSRVEQQVGPAYEEAHKILRIVAHKFAGAATNPPDSKM